MNWLPFQGAPFRALFVYHVRMLRHLLFGKKRADIFLDFEHPTLQGQSPASERPGNSLIRLIRCYAV